MFDRDALVRRFNEVMDNVARFECDDGSTMFSLLDLAIAFKICPATLNQIFHDEISPVRLRCVGEKGGEPIYTYTQAVEETQVYVIILNFDSPVCNELRPLLESMLQNTNPVERIPTCSVKTQGGNRQLRVEDLDLGEPN